MDSYLKGRPKTQRFHANIPAPKGGAHAALNQKEPEPEDIVRAKPEPGVENAPLIDMIMREGVVRRIIIHMQDGQRLELECQYEDDPTD
jgi:hypothetical protein